MNFRDAERLWSGLREAGIVEGDAPGLDVEAGTPWPVRWLTGVGAWIAVPLLIGFVFALIDWRVGESTGLIVIGLVFLVLSLPWLRSGSGEFQRQTGTVVNLAGILLVGLGVGFATEGSINAAAVVMAMIAVGMFALSPQWLHRFLCAGVLLGCLFWLLVGERAPADRLALAQVLVVWATMAVWLVRLYVDPGEWPRRLLDPLAWALTFAALLLAWTAPWLAGFVDDPRAFWVAPLRLAAAAALPLVAFALVYPRRHALGAASSFGLVAATLVLAWLWCWAPGVTVSISLLLLAVPLGAPMLFALSIGSLGVSLLLYYYHLGDSLLAKSLALAIAGAVVLVLYLILRARSRQVSR